MEYNTFLNNSINTLNSQKGTVICGKIILHTEEWEISFVCDFCHKSLSTLSDLLRHSFNRHIEDVPPEKQQTLCGSELVQRVDIECANFKGKTRDFDHQIKQKPLDTVKDIITAEDDNISKGNDEHNSNDELTKSIISTVYISTDAESTDDENSKQSNVEFEFLAVEVKKQPSQQNQKPQESTKFTCDLCAETFEKERLLANHKHEKHGQKKFVCEQCGMGLSSKTNLRVHRLRHLGIKPHSCTLCKKTFTTKTDMKIHMRSHTGERPFKCEECNQTFAHTSHLAIHRRRHANVRPHLCQNCGRTFFTSSRLHDHMATHSTERPHKCEKCNSTFTSRKSLLHHMLVHSGVKRHGCQFCGKRFTQKSNYNSHMKTVHKDDLQLSNK